MPVVESEPGFEPRSESGSEPELAVAVAIALAVALVALQGASNLYVIVATPAVKKIIYIKSSLHR